MVNIKHWLSFWSFFFKLTSTSISNVGKKGNSLFAEVDDQRQAMRHDMKSMRDKYAFVSSELDRMHAVNSFESKR